jgi:ABC-type branched-subunit amino acid transport system ATPase component
LSPTSAGGPLHASFTVGFYRAPAMSNVLAVEAVNVTKRYGDLVAVDGVSIDVGQGEVYGVPGPNGAGKTTFLRMLFGLIRSDGGTIHLFGRTWDSDGPYDQQAVRPRRRTTSSVTFPLLARQSAAELAVEVAPVIGTAPELTTLTLKRRG